MSHHTDAATLETAKNHRKQFLVSTTRTIFLLFAFALTGQTQPASEFRGEVLFQMHINPEMRVKVTTSSAAPTLIQNEWRTFLVRVENESGTKSPLQITVLNPTDARSGTNAWLEAEVVNDAKSPAALSGRSVEHRLIRLRCRVAGKREGQFSLHVGQGTQDLGFRSEVAILFQCQPSQANQSTIQQ